jgi:putative transposase
VIMPNHMHALVHLNTPIHDTANLKTLNTNNTVNNPRQSAISPKAYSLSVVIRSFKSAVTYHANRLQIKNGWQPRFFDRIVRNEMEFESLMLYIHENPIYWPETPPNPNGFPENCFPLR